MDFAKPGIWKMWNRQTMISQNRILENHKFGKYDSRLNTRKCMSILAVPKWTRYSCFAWAKQEYPTWFYQTISSWSFLAIAKKDHASRSGGVVG
jgi:hypothetical protein